MAKLPHNTICVYSFSKYFGATGWRSAVIAIHRDNIFDRLIARLPRKRKSEMQQRYGHEFWHGHALKKLPAKAVQRLKMFWPHLIEAILQSDKPQMALVRLMPLVESVMRRTVYLVMLIESKGALQRLVKMATVSPWICEELTHYPVFFLNDLQALQSDI